MRGARSVASEVERQLRGFPRQGGVAQVPHDFTPSYKASIDVALKGSTEHVPLSLALGLALPVLLGVSLKSRLLSEDPLLAAAGLAAFVAIATLTALLFGLCLDASHTTLQNAKRLSPPRGASSGFAASLGVGTVAEILGHSATPALGLVVKVTAVTALLMVPLLT
jgi:Na+/H+-translocating membrane pyrophosphatase